MSVMSDLDLMVRDGERTAEDFIGRGFDARTARAMADLVAALPHACERVERVTCGACDATWCERCDPAPSALCHTCHGRGHSTAALEPEGAFGHGPGCYGECDGLYDCGA